MLHCHVTRLIYDYMVRNKKKVFSVNNWQGLLKILKTYKYISVSIAFSQYMSSLSVLTIFCVFWRVTILLAMILDVHVVYFCFQSGRQCL